jgi:hypothetical protein
MKRFLIIMICAGLPMSLCAQHFSNKAKVDPVNVTSFYKIKINPDIVSYSNDQFQDLRLFDNDGKEVPYLLNKEVVGEQNTAFATYGFKISNDGNKSIVIIENPNKDSIQQFLFEMKNANATRLLRISGSDNKADWYVVRDSFYFESLGDDNSPMIQRSLHFPETDYAFYEVEISNGANESPLNVIRVGKNSTSYIAALFQRVNNLSYKIVDSNKSTYIHFKMKPGNKIDKLSFNIDAPEMYKRSLIITKIMYADGQSNPSSTSNVSEISRIDNQTMNAELASNGSTNIDVGSFLGEEKCDSFIIQIQNLDDAPLHFKSIEAFQLGTTLTAKMEKGKTYFLYFGDSLLAAPAYDLVYFNKNIPANITSVNVQSVQAKDQPNKDEYNGDKDKWIVWAGLGIAGVTILLLTMNMMKKMKHTES